MNSANTIKFDLEKSIEILERTPFVIEAYLSGLSDDWLKNNEGSESWSPFDILGHLVHGEKTDWISRMEIILSESNEKKFEPFDRFAQLNENQNKTIEELIEEFKLLRAKNIITLKSFQISESALQQEGMHPDLGTVTLKQLLSTWVVHDLGHIAQISRVMAKQYKQEVGPWISYLGILNK